MDFAYTQRNPMKHATGLGLAVAFHVFLGYALVSGLASKVVDVIKQPLDVKLIQEFKPPPPPEAKAPPPPMPKVATPPPPAYVPPPEVVVAPAPVAPTIAAVSVTPQPPTPPAPVVQAPAAPPHVPVRVPAVTDAARNCPKPEYPALSRRNEEEGTVVLRFLIGTDGLVKDSAIANSSGSKRLDEAARDALSRCRFKAGTSDGVPETSWANLKYTWRLDD